MKTYSIIQDFFNYLDEYFKGQIPNLIYFAIGLGLGIILFGLTLLLALIISKIKQKISNKKQRKQLTINYEYKQIVSVHKDSFINYYKDLELKDKLKGILKTIITMMEDISSLYYKDSKNPMFEISIEQLIDFLSYFVKRIELIIDNLLQGKLKIINRLTNENIKNIKLSKAFELIESRKSVDNKPKKNNIFKKFFTNVAKKTVFKISNDIIDYEFERLIDDLGEDINKLYSKQELNFTDITRKEKRRLKKNARNYIEGVGDHNA